MKKIFLLVSFLLLTIPVYGKSIHGANFTTGSSTSQDPLWHKTNAYDWQISSLFYLTGWRFKYFNLYFEGCGSWIDFSKENVLSFDTTFNIQGNLKLWKQIYLYGFYGLGLGYWSKTPSRNLVNLPPLGVVQYGLGIKFPLSLKLFGKIGTSFKHFSAIRRDDCGCNSYFLGLGVEWN